MEELTRGRRSVGDGPDRRKGLPESPEAGAGGEVARLEGRGGQVQVRAAGVGRGQAMQGF